VNDPRLRARYGLKYDPFAPNLPAADLWSAPGFERFAHASSTSPVTAASR
jgi:hypothetical protein